MFTRRFRPTVARRTRNISPRARLLVQALERRDVPATFNVINNNDGLVTAFGDLPGSLRQAIFDANNTAGDDIVSITYAGTITMAAGVGDFTLMTNMAVVGPGASSLTIQGTDSRIFNVSDNTAASINVSISGMTITGGVPNEITPTDITKRSGGGILCRNEILSLDSMVITGNKTPSMTLDSSLAWGHGGGIAMSGGGQGGSLTINNCQIENNTASYFGAADGGGIYFFFPSKASFDNTFMMTNSTVSGNVSGKRGGGIYFTHYTSDTDGSFNMINSTVSSNIAQNEFAGGIIISGAQGIPMNIINSTITNNTATGSVGGGGLALNTGTGTINVESSIIADNVGTTAAPDVYISGNSIKAQASVFSQNLSFASGSAGNTTVAFGGVLLAPLANNGGLTKTHLLRAGSPAIDSGTVATATLTTLSTAVSSGTIGFVTVNAPSVIAVGQKFQIDAEIMQVTAISGSTITVNRAVDGSVTATHASAAPLKQVVPLLTTVGATSITAAATTIQVTSSVGLTPGMAMQIDSEVVWINAAVGSNTITVARGKNGTTAATHAAGTVVRAVPAFLGNLSVALGGTGADTIATVFSSTRLGVGEYFQIDSEILKVVAVSGSTVTVARAQNASVIAAHAVNAPLTMPYEQRGSAFPRIVTGGATPGFGPRIDAGAVEYNPAAVAAKVSSVSATSGADSTITVVFSSTVNIDTTTLNNVFVTGPNGFNQAATPTGNSGTATSVTATYTITAPVNSAAGWDYSDNGTYSVQVNPNTVADITPSTLNTTVIGQFKAAITNTWTVDNAGDSDDSVYTAGQLTLREAVRLANESTGTLDTIAFDTATLGATPTINFNTEIQITDSVSINPGNVAVTLDGGAVTRLFNVYGPGVIDVSLSSLTMQNALIGYPYSGGAISVDAERLTITDCVFNNNSAFGGGGAIAAGGVGNTVLSVTRSSFSNNTGGAIVAGGILSTVDLTVVNSSFTQNTGVGLANGNGSLRIYGSTFEGNLGSGISMAGAINSNGFLIKNTTVSGNSSSGISLNITGGYGVTALIQNSTITRNTTTGTGGGGGILLGTGTTNNLVTLQNNIIAENSAEGFAKYGWDLASLGTSSVIGFKGDYNVIGILDSTSKVVGIGNQAGTFYTRVNPMLQPIANNGGLTRTHMPYSGSPAQDYSSPFTTLSSTTTLNGGIDASQVTMTLTSAAAANVAIGNVIQIDAETMTVNAVSTNTITVNARGSGVPHTTLATVSNNTAPVVNVSTIAGAITSGQTTIALTAGGVAAAGITTAAPNNAIQIDQEAMTVTGISGDTITVTRGVSPGSVPVAGAPITGVAAAHSGGATVSRRIMVFPGTLAIGLSSPNPAGNYFKIDSEIMLALGNGSNGQNTFLRGQLGTSMAAHSLNSVVSYVPAANLQMLSLGIDSITTSIGLISANSLAVGSYIQIDSEMLLVTAVTSATNTITVTRGQLATSAAAHAMGTEIFQAFDQRGNAYSRTQGFNLDAGAVEIDPNIPYARTSDSTVSVGGGVSQTIVVTYTDNVAIDGTTIDTNNIRIVPPSGPDIYPTYVASSPDKGSTTSALTYSVSYTFTPPGGNWDFTDNGTYQIWTDASKQVTDTSATNVQIHQIGNLKVGIANTFIVTNNNDVGAGSLREAINQSNTNAGVTDSITFDTTVFNVGTPQTITLAGELLITDQVLITGPGASIVRVSGANSSRVFTIDTPTSGNSVVLYGMTIADGNGFGTIDTFTGGGGVLIQDEAVTIDSCVVTGNTVTTLSLNQGGGILLNALGGSLTLKDSTLSNNFSTGNGGGLEVRYVNNIVNIQNTTISGNSTGTNGSGAALDFTQQAVGAVVNPSTITIDNSTFFNNAAGSAGGAIRFGQGSGTSRIAKYAITNSTFNNNVSFTTGGAISLGGAAEFTLLNSTISGNYALQGGGGIAGATTSSLYTAINMAIVNSVISGNNNKYWPDLLFGGTNTGVTTTTITIPVVNSFIGAVDSATLKRLDNQGSTIGTNVNAPLDAKLAPLAFNGGTVKTMMPLPGSPLLNAGSNAPSVRMTTLTADNGTTGTTAIGASSITSSQTTIGVTSAAGIVAGQTEIRIDSESMFVTGVSGLTLTVIRGTGTSSSGSGSSAASHAAGAVITFDTGARVVAPYWSYVGLPIQIDSEVMTVVQTNGAGATTLSQAAGIGTGDTSFTVGSSSGMPNPTIGFNGQLVLDAGTASAETVTITALSGSTVTVTRGGSPFAHAFGSTISNLSLPLLVNRAQANTTAAAHTAGTAVNRAAVRFLAFLGAGGMDGVSSPTTVFVSDSRWMFPGMTIQIDSETMTVSSVPSTTSVTVTRTAPVAHLDNAIISRPFLSTDARGSARVNGTIDIGAVEVDPTLPLASGTFADITTAGGTSYSFNVVYTDDVGIDTNSFNSNNVKVTAPDGVTTIAVTYNPGDYTLGVGSATVKYSIPAFGGPTWQSSADGFYDISVKAGTAATDTSANAVYPSSLGSMHVAIVKNLVVTNTNDAGAGSLRQNIIDANANVGVTDVITFDSTVFNTPQSIVMFTGQMQITDPVTITGPGMANVFIDGNFVSRVFDIKLNPQYWTSTVTLTGMTIANGKLGNSVPAGAGIVDEAGVLVMDSITMTGHSASGGGGALQLSAYYSPLTISNSVFTANTAGNGGAGIYVGNNGSGVNSISGQTNYPTNMLVSITNTLFDSNIGSNNGVAVRVDSGAVATLSNDTFTNNFGIGSTGGAISANGSNLTVTNSVVTNNITSSVTTGTGNAGGFYFSGAATATISNTNISSNTAGTNPNPGQTAGSGGGAYVNGTASVTFSNDTINNNVSSSTATNNGGGAIFMVSTANTVTINNSVIMNNQAVNMGGGIFASSSSTLNVNSSTISNNSTTAPYNFASSTVQMMGGGALFTAGGASITINSSTLANNTAALNGGAILGQGMTTSATNSGTVYINNSTLTGNTALSIEANSGGGGIFWAGTGGMLMVSNSTLSGNSAAAQGGAFLAGGNAITTTFNATNSMVFRNSTIANNTAALAGGGLNFNSTGGNTSVTLMSTIVTDNVSSTPLTGNDLRTGSASTKFNTFNTLVGDTTNFGSGTVSGVLVAGPANLAALANNGGPTQTHRLTTGSTAIDAGLTGTGVTGTDLLTTVGATSVALGATTIQVTSAAKIMVGTRLQIDSEIMTVSAVSTNTITVNRAQAGSVAATHLSGANVNVSSLLGANDQRGSGYLRAVGASADIGAYEVQAPATVTSVVLSDGTGVAVTQRSMVRQIIVTFSTPVNFTGPVANAFTVHRTGNSLINGNPIGDVMLLATPSTGPATTVTITFNNADTTFVESGGTIDQPLGSLIDGLYDFTIDASKVSTVDGALDGDGIGGFGGNYAVIGSTGNGYYRFFGDSNGDGAVNQIDFNAFRLAFLGGPSNVFDFNGDGQVNQTDYNAFRLRFLSAP